MKTLTTYGMFDLLFLGLSALATYIIDGIEQVDTK
jgi:hypothetical protein